MSEPDLFILAILSRPRTILDKEYMVTWDCLNNQAQVLFRVTGEKEWQNGKTFTTELQAHKYLDDLKSLTPPPDFDWRTLCQDE